MNFQEGTAVHNNMRGRDGVFRGLLSETVAFIDYGSGPEFTSVKYLGLTERQQKIVDRKAKLEAAREEREDLQEALRLQNKAAKFAATPVEVLKRTDPEALAMLADYCKQFGYHIEISCAPRDFAKTASDISFSSSLTESEAVDYKKIVSEASRSAKYDLMFPDGLSENLADRLSVLLWSECQGQQVRGFRAKTGEAEINSRQLVDWLMKEHNFLPIKWR